VNAHTNPVTSHHTDALFAAEGCLESIAVITKDRGWTWGEVHGEALTLSSNLPDGHAVCNLCSSYLSFLITWLAALRRNLPIILPPSRGTADLKHVIALDSRPIIVVADHALSPEIDATWLNYQPIGKTQKKWSAANLRWEAALETLWVTLYTSGSTGTPEPQPRSLKQLFIGAQQLTSRLEQACTSDPRSNLDVFDRIVSSVSPQHMFGIEAVLMLSMTSNKPVMEGKPLLPADIQDAMTRHPSRAAWVTTPLHLQAITRVSTKLTSCVLTLTSTMPLSREIARRTEALISGPVIEIYGSTETGALATRRTATTAVWQKLDSVMIKSNLDGAQVTGSHFDSPKTVTDRLVPVGSRHFELIGRNTDMVKIGGRRTSLAALNAILQEISAIDDAIFMAAPADENKRPILIYTKSSSLSPAQITSALREKIDPVFLPRIIIRVDHIPRNDRGKVAATDLKTIYQRWQKENSTS